MVLFRSLNRLFCAATIRQRPVRRHALYAVARAPKAHIIVAILLAAAGLSRPRAALGESQPSSEAIIQKALARAQQAEFTSDRHDYTYTKVSVTEELDGGGKLKERKEKMYQVYFKGGTTHVNLLEVNGRPPAPSDMRKQADTDSSLRQLLGQPKSATGDNRESFLTPELAARFDFQLLDLENLNGRETYRIAFRPKSPPAPAHRVVDRLLDRISGTIWIDSEEFEVARADVRLGSEVDLLGGMVGCLKKLVFTMIRTRVADGIWLNSFSSADVEARKLLDSMRIKTKSQSSNFKPIPTNF